MTNLFADLHIHVGMAGGKAVKITASRGLDLRCIIYNDAPQKGLDIVGIVDAGSTLVSGEIEGMLAIEDLVELEKGGFMARNGILVITGCEVESREGVHLISYLPNINSITKWQEYIKPRVRNMMLSTQKVDASVRDIIKLSMELDGIFCLAHAFTPHKGVYGMWTDKLASKLGEDIDHIKVLELGLSADTSMADMLTETRRFTYLSNSDAHSSPNVGREYNLLRMEARNFQELRFCLENQNGRRVIANYGLHPRLGKYHRSFCPACEKIIDDEPPVISCPNCGYVKLVMGVYDRIVAIRDYDSPRHPKERPPYYYRVPLKFLPGIGPRMFNNLMHAFLNEIEIIENVPIENIKQVAGENVAAVIGDMRMGKLCIIAGGGGKYGKVKKDCSKQ